MALTQQLVIVRRNQFATFASLAQAFSDEPNVRLIWDRRGGDRRLAAAQPADADRRSGDRRDDPSLAWGGNEYLLLTLADRTSPDSSPSKAVVSGEAQAAHEHSQLIRDMGPDLDAAVSSDLAVLISGGDAVSRKSLAHWIHRRSDRSTRPMVVVDSAAFTELLAATVGRDPARASARSGGTLLIEEIAQCSWQQQSELVRFLDGISQPQAANGKPETRLISGTDGWLLDRVASREFRPDLFYRLNAIHLVLPAGARTRSVDSGIALAALP